MNVKKLVISFITILVAVALFIVSNNDNIQIMGKYRYTSIEEQYQDMDERLEDIKFYISFLYNGKVGFKVDIPPELYENLSDTEKEYLEDAFDDLKKEQEDARWKIENDKIFLYDVDNEDELDDDFGKEYKLTTSKLSVFYDEDDDDTIEFDKESMAVISSPCVILRIVSVVFALFAILFLLVGGKKSSLRKSTKIKRELNKTCPNCGSVMGASDKFCEKCGFALIGNTTESKPKFCMNCGAVLEPNSIFCEKCGTRNVEPDEPATISKIATQVPSERVVVTPSASPSTRASGTSGLKSTFSTSSSSSSPMNNDSSYDDEAGRQFFNNGGDL